MKNFTLFLILMGTLLSCETKKESDLIYESEKFSIYKDKVVQGSNLAEVISPTQMKSNYRSPASSTFSRLVKFKFSINEKDNELPPGADHWLIIGDESESEVVRFGEAPPPFPEQPNEYLPTNYEYTFRVDVSTVLEQFKENGFYLAHDGSKVAEADFKGFYIAGGSEPLTWDFVNLQNQGLQLQPTEDPNIYSITLLLNPFDEATNSDKEWTVSEDISNRPRYVSEQPLVDALFNLSLEEAIKNIEPDSTLRTGAKWGGVWTRDVSYSTLLAFAYHEPEVAKISLRKKIRRGRIVQDTGSGGAWPVSSDRTTWVLAAWEIYKVTGDQDWLDEIYPVVKATLDDDYKTIYDKPTGMYSGESSFLDWREQTYPKWMDNKDIYVSLNLGTNVVHYQAHMILAEMARLKNEAYTPYEERAAKIKKGINDYLWMKERGYYAQFTYGRGSQIVSPRYEALGEALAILFDVADEEKAASIISRSPLTEYGATCIYPQIPGIPPYHNNGIWPFVQSYWNWAAAKAGNESVLNHGLASVYRAAGLFLTNYENMVAETGDFLGTEINSDRMLWSMAGNLAMVHRVFMGIEFHVDGLSLNPVVPKAYGGSKSLSNFKYRNAILNVTVNGYGTEISSITINGNSEENAFIPANAEGEYDIVIELAGNEFPSTEANFQPNRFTPATVLAQLDDGTLSWKAVDQAVSYRVYLNGQLAGTTEATQWEVDGDKFGIYQVSALDLQGYEGFSCEPIVVSTEEIKLEAENFAPKASHSYSNFSGAGFVEISKEENRDISIKVDSENGGEYLLDLAYSNGSGRWNTNNKCAIRSLTVNKDYYGTLVFPQRGMDEWSDWGFSNARRIRLNPGTNEIRIHFEDWNENMNVEVNTAMLDYVRLIRVN